jgi:hypothetical protein
MGVGCYVTTLRSVCSSRGTFRCMINSDCVARVDANGLRQRGLSSSRIRGSRRPISRTCYTAGQATHVYKGCWKKSLGAKDAWQIAHSFRTFDADAKKERRGRIQVSDEILVWLQPHAHVIPRDPNCAWSRAFSKPGMPAMRRPDWR